MRTERLLERISNTGYDDPDRRGLTDLELTQRSIRNHLIRVLNTRQGSAQMDVEYGLPDYSSMASRFSTENQETVQDIAHNVKTAIDKYEPRLERARVKFLDKKEFEITMTMEIEADLRTDSGRVPVTIRATVLPEGRITIEI